MVSTAPDDPLVFMGFFGHRSEKFPIFLPILGMWFDLEMAQNRDMVIMEC